MKTPIKIQHFKYVSSGVLAWGASGRPFKSARPDHNTKPINISVYGLFCLLKLTSKNHPWRDFGGILFRLLVFSTFSFPFFRRSDCFFRYGEGDWVGELRPFTAERKRPCMACVYR